MRELEEIGSPFSVADIAERAGVSRATIYRDNALRAIVGARGDGDRPVSADVHARVCDRYKALQGTAKDLRKRLAQSESSWEQMRERALAAEAKLSAAQRHIEALAGRLAASTSSHAPLTLAKLAARIGPDGMRKARRALASALHPDLYSQNPEAAEVAAELLRAVNEVV